MKLLLTNITAVCFIFNILPAQNAGNAALFDGMDDYVWLTANISSHSEATIEMWFRPDSFDQSQALGTGSQGSPGANWDNGYFLGTHPASGDGLTFGFWTGGWNWQQTNIIPINGNWYHIAASWGNEGIKTYINGTKTNNSAYLGSNESYVVDLIGTSSWGLYFWGAIDEVRYWNVARDSVQINSTMYNTLGNEYTTTTDSGLIAYYKFDILEDLGIDSDGADDFRDYSASANHSDSRGGLAIISSGAFGTTSINDKHFNLPENIKLFQNYPNPFNPSTTIAFTIPFTDFVKLEVFNITGQKVRTIMNKKMESGNYEVEFNASDLASGIYFYQIQAGKFQDVKKMILIK